MTKRSRVERPIAMFTKPGQVANLTLADGFRFVMLVRNEHPTLVPIFEQGQYEIDIPAVISADLYPIGVLMVDAAHAPMILKLPVAAVNGMLDAAAQHIAGASK